MAKKKNKRIVKAPKTEEIKPVETEVEVVEPDVENTEVEANSGAKVETKKSTKEDKEKDKNASKKGKKTKKSNENKSGGLGRKFKEVFSELKKVSWPSFKSVVKNTGVVIVVVLVFTVVLFGIDRGLAALYNLIPR